jgi:hypothetical protein
VWTCIDLYRLEITQCLSRIGKHPTADSVSSLAKQRDRLIQSLVKFNVDSRKYMGLEAYNECIGEGDGEGAGQGNEGLSTEFETAWDPIDPPDLTQDTTRPETFVIALPSALPEKSAHRQLLTRLLQMEMELRRGHANDCLGSIRRTIGQEAFQYKKVLRPAHDKIHQTRAQTSIQNIHRGLVLQARIYKRTREAMIKLGIDSDVVESLYRPLSAEDIKVSSAANNPNIAGSTQMKLSWIWTLHQGVQTNDNHLTECGFLIGLYWPLLIYYSLSRPLAPCSGPATVLFSAPQIPEGVTGLRRSPPEWDRSPQE